MMKECGGRLSLHCFVIYIIYEICNHNFSYEYSESQQQKCTNTICHIKDEHPSSVPGLMLLNKVYKYAKSSVT